MKKIILFVLFSFTSVGCSSNAEEELLEDIVKMSYELTVCENECVSYRNNLSDYVNQAKMMGVEDARIDAAVQLGENRGERAVDSRKKSQRLVIENKCKSQNLTICPWSDSCCPPSNVDAAKEAAPAADAPVILADSSSSYSDAYDAATAAADAAAPATDAPAFTSDLIGNQLESQLAVDEAKALSSLFASMAPMEMDSMTTMVGSYPIGSTVVLLAVINPDGSDLSNEDILNNVSTISKDHEDAAIKSICTDKKLLPYLNRGLKFRYRYRLLTGEQLFEMNVHKGSCIK